MRTSTDLGKIHSATQNRLIRIRRAYGNAHTLAGFEKTSRVATCVIELDNLLINSLREFTIGSLTSSRTISGVRVRTNHTFSGAGEVGAYALSVLNIVKYRRLNSPLTITRINEQKIRDPRDLLRVFIACGASNVGSLQLALTLNSPLFRDIASVRNFYAHRNDDTWGKVRRLALAAGLIIKHSDNYVLSTIAGRPVTVFEDWLDDASLFFDFVFQ